MATNVYTYCDENSMRSSWIKTEKYEITCGLSAVSTVGRENSCNFELYGAHVFWKIFATSAVVRAIARGTEKERERERESVHSKPIPMYSEIQRVCPNKASLDGIPHRCAFATNRHKFEHVRVSLFRHRKAPPFVCARVCERRCRNIDDYGSRRRYVFLALSSEDVPAASSYGSKKK